MGLRKRDNKEYGLEEEAGRVEKKEVDLKGWYEVVAISVNRGSDSSFFSMAAI